MCCRYLLLRENLRDLLARLGMPDEEGDVGYFADRYNMAPCARVPVVRRRAARVRGGVRALGSDRGRGREREWECVSMVWNFGVAAESGARVARPADAIRRSVLLNARAESLWEKPAFREAARGRRCLIPASGFYEWARVGRARLPWLFQLREAEPFFLAGIWEGDGCAIVTTEPNELMRPVHGRMPAIIAVEDAGAWLDGEGGDGKRARLLLAPFATGRMAARRVSRFVNDARNEGVACVGAGEWDDGRENEADMLPLFG